MRKQHPSFGVGEIEWVDCRNDRIAAFRRHTKEESILVIHNLNGSNEIVNIESSSRGVLREILTDKLYEIQGNQFSTQLGPYQFLWLEEKSAIL